MEYIISFGLGITVLLILSIIKLNIHQKNRNTIFTISFVIDSELTIEKQLRKGEFVEFFVPNQLNRRFLGWYDDDIFSGEKVTYYMVYDKDKKFFARWE